MAARDLETIFNTQIKIYTLNTWRLLFKRRGGKNTCAGSLSLPDSLSSQFWIYAAGCEIVAVREHSEMPEIAGS